MTKGQLALPLKVELSQRTDPSDPGVEMGVLSNGSAFLTGRALARLCGVANSSISDAGAAWQRGRTGNKLAESIAAQGFSRDSLYSPIRQPIGGAVHAFEDDVCMLILEYYALDSGNETAKRNYRLMARAGLRAYVYGLLRYQPKLSVPAAFQRFADRMTLASAPVGYFSVFTESASMIMDAIRAGLDVDEHTVPDISIGQTWSAHWKADRLADRFGQAGTHDHNYPDYFPQAKSNPQEIRVYPLAALGEFRLWMQGVYLPTKFPAYVAGKVKHGALPEDAAAELLALFSGPAPLALPPPRVK